MSAHWGLPDPAHAEGSEAAISQVLSDAYGMLHTRITTFCALPLATLDRLSLQRRIEDIGKMRRHPNAESAGLPSDRP